MKKRYLILLAIVCMITACNKESFIESVGMVDIPTGSEEKIGHLIFTSKTAASKCGNIEIFVDDKSIGKIDKDYSSGIDCKTAPVNNIILRVAVKEGSHKVKVVYNNKCKPDGTASPSTVAGKCIWYHIQ